MAENSYWADGYVEKKMTARDAVRLIKPGRRVFIGSSCGEPQHLVRALSEEARGFTDLEIVRLMTLESTPLTMIAEQTDCQNLNIRSFYLGSGKPKSLSKDKRFITPINLSAVPRLFKGRQLPIHVALIQVSPPDDFGWMSLGVSVDITLAAAQSADLVIAQVNPKMPRVLGHSFVHVNDVDAIVEHEEDLIAMGNPPEMEVANTIGRFIARLIDDGSTIHVTPGVTQTAILLALSGKKDLGVHTEIITGDIMRLVSSGVITNRKKGFNDGKLVASGAMGSEYLYEYLNDNPSIEFHPSDYVNDPGIIASHNKMVSMTVVMSMDLTGQAAADALYYNNYSGVTGILDFARGAVRSEGGKSILMLRSTSADGAESRIVSKLDDTAVVVPRGDVHYVVTEYGTFNLFGKSIQERAIGMIGIAHPDFRDKLFAEAKEMGLISGERVLSEAVHGIYPIHLEEAIDIDGEKIQIRPAKLVDERRIQEHFYHMDTEDVMSRFFHEKTSFLRNDVESMFKIDYVRDLTIVAVVGEIGFGKVVAVGEYLLEPSRNLAEVAFSVDKKYQGKKLGKILLKKLAEAANENGISGLFAVTSPQNRGMRKLFDTLPFKVKTVFEEDMVVLISKFDEMGE